MGYWEDRLAKSQNKRTEKSIKETEEQLRKYYSSSMKKIIGQFEETYNKLLLSIEEGKEPTPADLYKLDKYWQMQGQLRQELEKLGDKQVGALSDSFMRHYQGVYESLSLPSGKDYGTIDKKGAYQMINQIWCTDGKSWSDRVWTNTDRLQETLNQHLIDCVVTGKKPTELKKILQEDFQVSYSRADSVVRTEMAHIQTQAAQQRYIDYGIAEVEVLADEDERRCEVCGKLHGKKFKITEKMPVPAHPRCRCCVIPVVDTGNKKMELNLQLFAEKSEASLKGKTNISNTTVKLTEVQQEAQRKVEELKKQDELVFHNLDTEHHKEHCRYFLGKDDETTLLEYQKMASAFIKKDIDGNDVDGFISEAGWLFKYEHSTKQFGLLSPFGTISTYFVPDEPEEYWKKQINEYKKKE